MWYVAVAISLIVLGIVLRYTVLSPIPRTITSLADAERLVDYYVGAANRRLRREAWMLTFVVVSARPRQAHGSSAHRHQLWPTWVSKLRWAISADVGQCTRHAASEGKDHHGLREAGLSGRSRDLYLGEGR